MLLAEIHGKASEEDLLTSAVFGHLRDVKDRKFWNCVFSHACLVGPPRTSLAEALELQDCGFRLTDPVSLEIKFWPVSKCGKHIPDLVLRFKGADGRYLVMIVEVKLDSTKSGKEDADQLKRYFDLLHSEVEEELNGWLADKPEIALVYLTKHYSGAELRKSISSESSGPSSLALRQKRMFALRWQDVLEAARQRQDEETSKVDLLDELTKFFEWRGLERFNGFDQLPAESKRKPNGKTPVHSVSCRLLSDLDAWMDLDSYEPLYPPATIEKSNNPKYGAQVMFRDYKRTDKPNEIVGIYILFFDDGPDMRKAAILAAKLTVDATDLRKPRGWLDPQKACPDWNKDGEHKKVISLGRISETISDVIVIVDRLSSITDEASVMALVRQLLPG
jgi:hypothetical protein